MLHCSYYYRRIRSNNEFLHGLFDSNSSLHPRHNTYQLSGKCCTAPIWCRPFINRSYLMPRTGSKGSIWFSASFSATTHTRRLYQTDRNNVFFTVLPFKRLRGVVLAVDEATTRALAAILFRVLVTVALPRSLLVPHRRAFICLCSQRF